MIVHNRKDKLEIIGLMSGTSLDGLDIAHTSFDFKGNQVAFELLNCETTPYDSEILTEINKYNSLSVPEMLILDKKIGNFFAEKVSEFIKKNKLNKNQIDAIACHGQTIFHQPNYGFTYQIGCGSTLAYHTGIKVINDFRTRDVIAGGQGAPLVPIGDFNLFSNQAQSFLNIGGFTNISFKKENKIIAFDICPGNLPLNLLANKLGFAFDKNGDIAKTGTIIPEILQTLNSIEFYQMNPPKSLGTEWLEGEFYKFLVGKYEPKDLLRTIVEHIAFQISTILNKEKIVSVFITGGGAKNNFLIDRIKMHFEGQVMIPEMKIIDFKEALVFAYLGALYLRNESTTLISVTGAERHVCSGVLHIPGF
ncbi:MAG: anhydro-N-acetylmuramic acid kinase [Bacteroidetes bacterium]|nr:anhydro-N-acetylmuramic acid kinase [Bacteroidota bacterium]